MAFVRSLIARSISLRGQDTGGWILFVVACFLVCWSLRAWLDYGALFGELVGKPLVERGAIGANEWRCFLPRAGRLHVQAAEREARTWVEQLLAQARREGRDSATVSVAGRSVTIRSEADLPSPVAEGWVQVVRAGTQLPNDAQVWLQASNAQLFYYATTLWFPRRVDLAPDGALQDGSAQRTSAQDELRRRGYSHVVEATPQSLRVTPLVAGP